MEDTDYALSKFELCIVIYIWTLFINVYVSKKEYGCKGTREII